MSRFEKHPIVLRKLTVLRVTDVTPRMRRITLGGAELSAFSRDGWELPPFRTVSADDHIKIMLHEAAGAADLLPTQDDGHLDWPDGSIPLSRDYTVRRFDADALEIDIDVVRHADGLASGWAERVTPGETIHIAGPRGSFLIPEGLAHYVFAADETGLPAIARFMEELPAGPTVTVLAEIDGPAEKQDLGERANVTWLLRNGAAAGTTDLLPRALAAADFAPDETYIWAAGENATMDAVRDLLTKERGLPKDQMHVTGYWRLTQSG